MNGVVEFIPREEGSDFGVLVIRCEYPDLDKPQKIVVKYPVHLKAFRPNIAHYLGKEVRSYTAGSYVLMHAGEQRRFDLIEGGKTKPYTHEIVPIPKPKGVRSELRWRNMRWEKYLKSKGWVPV